MSQSQALKITRSVSIPLSEFEFSFARSQGPGGQNVNKVNTKATLRWRPQESESLPAPMRDRFLAKFGNRMTRDGEFIVNSQRYRDQARNVDDCLGKLQQMILEVATAPKKRRPTKPSRGSQERRLRAKQEASERKQRRRTPRLDD